MSKKGNKSISADEAGAMIIAPYITEKTFNMIEKENKLTFIVAERTTKKQVSQALFALYESDVREVNTSRTIQGKKAIVKFHSPQGARDLATKLGLV
jgi:large subunit ribosomal protein L23